MGKYDARIKMIEKRFPRAQFDFIMYYGPDHDGIIHDHQGTPHTEQEFMDLTGGVFMQIPFEQEDNEIMDRLMAGDDTIKPIILVRM